jgi:hypothetical protein
LTDFAIFFLFFIFFLKKKEKLESPIWLYPLQWDASAMPRGWRAYRASRDPTGLTDMIRTEGGPHHIQPTPAIGATHKEPKAKSQKAMSGPNGQIPIQLIYDPLESAAHVRKMVEFLYEFICCIILGPYVSRFCPKG